VADNNIAFPNNMPTPSKAPSTETLTKQLRLLASIAAGVSKMTDLKWDDVLAEKLAWAAEQTWLVELIAQALALFDGASAPGRDQVMGLLTAAAAKATTPAPAKK
jgi:hypothetical protein